MITVLFIKILVATVLIASFAAFLLILLAKWKVIEWIQVHGNDFFAKMANCDFCLSWWMNVILAVEFALTLGDCSLLVVPLFGTMITRKLL